jgi:YD repeat-containing protein
MSIVRLIVWWIILSTAVALGTVVLAAEQVKEYEYDAVGRLRKVITPETEVAYVLDAAGNRVSVTGSAGRGLPASITVPTNDNDGDYTISWGASNLPVTRYELFEARTPGFSDERKVYDGAQLSTALTARPDASYYYRVRGCDATGCGPRRAGDNAVIVKRPEAPSVPSGITIPTGDIDGSYTISWTASTGTVTAYELEEALGSGSFANIYSGTSTSSALSGRSNGTHSYRVRACNTFVCSAYRTGANSLLVTLPPSVPGAVTVPGYSNTGNYTVSWGASTTGIVTAYELLESRTPNETLIYSGTATSFVFSGKPEDVLSYRVRGCNGPACSAYTSAQGTAAVIYIDKIAPTPPTSVIQIQPPYTFSWSGGSTDSAGVGSGSGVGSWNVYRNGSYIGTSLSPNQSYRDSSPPGDTTLNYVVKSVDRAGNESVASQTSTLYVDTIPPTTPGNFRVTGVTTGSVSMAWDASSDAFGISRYRIVRVSGPTRESTTTSYVDETAASGTTYTYQVFAVDGNGVASAPASLTATTLAGAPSVPSMGGFMRSTTGRYTISWGASTGAVANYILEESTNPQFNPGTVSSSTIAVPTTSKMFTNGTGSYSYRVKACSATNVCSGYSATRNIEVCIGAC